jgi:hypothetical protein
MRLAGILEWNNSMRWFFLYPQETRPSGGVKQLRLLAQLLRELRIETFHVRHRADAQAPWDDALYAPLPVFPADFAFEDAGRCLGPDDVLVLPEVKLDRTLPITRGWPCRVALYNQGMFYGLRDRPARALIRQRIEFAIVPALHVAALTRRYLHLAPARIFQVPCWVWRGPFGDATPDCSSQRLAIACMPRKLPEHIRAVRQLVQSVHPDVPWIELDDLPESSIAQALRQTAIFFSTQDREGFGLPALEAMASGCLVAGYRGTANFPTPYATSANGLWVPDRAISEAAVAVSRAVELVRHEADELRHIRQCGRQTAQRFDRLAALRALGTMLDRLQRRSFDRATCRMPPLGWLNQLHAWHVLYRHRRFTWQQWLPSWLP